MTPPDLTAPELLDELRKLAQEATPGPWDFDGPADNHIVWSSAENRVCFMTSNGKCTANAAFIAAANPATITALLADHSRLREDVESLRAALEAEQKRFLDFAASMSNPGSMLFLDGRNEHGSHVLPSFPTNIDLVPEDVSEQAEDILKAAEALGFKEGDHVWATYRWVDPQIGEYGMVELTGYWDFSGIDTVVTAALSSIKKDEQP